MKKLLFTISFLYTICFAQIKADGVTNDLPALKVFEKSGGGILPCLPYRLIRITDTWAIPKLVSGDLYNKDGKLNPDSFQYAKSAKAITIDLNFCTIWLDNPDKTKAVIAYNALGRFDDNNTGVIKNGTLRGVGIGISATYTLSLSIDRINFKGFKNGLVLNNAYNTLGTNLHFADCERAEHDIRSHGSIFTNTTISFCKKGFEIRSNGISLTGYNTSNCNIGLHVAAGNNIITNLNLETTKVGEAQLIIGDSTGIKVDGNVFTGVIISAPNLKAIKWLKTAGQSVFVGGSALSTNYEVVSGSTATNLNLGFIGNLPTTITKKL